MSFWENFYNLCLQNGTKPNPAAKKIGLSSSTVTQWKKGSVPNSATVERVAEYFGVSVGYLLGSEQSVNNSPLSPHEEEQIKKYRTLDEIGIRAVDGLLDIEYERCTASSGTGDTPTTPMSWAVPSVEESKAIASADVDTHTLGELPETEEPFQKVPKDEV